MYGLCLYGGMLEYSRGLVFHLDMYRYWNNGYGCEILDHMYCELMVEHCILWIASMHSSYGIVDHVDH